MRCIIQQHGVHGLRFSPVTSSPTICSSTMRTLASMRCVSCFWSRYQLEYFPRCFPFATVLVKWIIMHSIPATSNWLLQLLSLRGVRAGKYDMLCPLNYINSINYCADINVASDGSLQGSDVNSDFCGFPVLLSSISLSTLHCSPAEGAFDLNGKLPLDEHCEQYQCYPKSLNCQGPGVLSVLVTDINWNM